MKKLAIVFPGQGSQYSGMGKALVDNFKTASHIYEEANDSLGFDLEKMIFDGSMAELTHSENAQPAVVTASHALFRVYMEEFGIKPDFTAGHSLGEISALIAAGGVDFRDGVRFARKRGALMHQAYTQKRGRVGLVIGLAEKQVEEAVDKISRTCGTVSITGYNSPSQILVAGEEKSLESLAQSIRILDGEFMPFSMLPMKVDAPYHSPLMNFLADEIDQELKGLDVHPLNWTVISNITARPYRGEHDIRKALSGQLVNPIKWSQTISYFEERRVETVIDIGPHYVLKTLVSECSKEINSYSYDLKSDLAELKNQLLMQ